MVKGRGEKAFEGDGDGKGRGGYVVVSPASIACF